MFVNFVKHIDKECLFVYIYIVNRTLIHGGAYMRKLVFIALIFITSVCIVTNVFGRGDKKETYTYYEEVNILNGESYWNIAQKYQSDGMDKKEYANYIMEFNMADTDELKAGQRIIVPVIKYKEI